MGAIDDLINRVLSDPFRNYFICLTYQKNASFFSDVLLSPCKNVLLFIRKTGNIQIVPLVLPLTSQAYDWLIENLQIYDSGDILCVGEVARQLIARGLDARMMLTSTVATCPPERFKDRSIGYHISDLEVRDLPEVVEIYKTVFKGFSSLDYMEEKLLSTRGRGVVLKIDGRIVSVAQTDFESRNQAVIVGVATRPEGQGKGYAFACMMDLCRKLVNEGKTMGLLYERDVIYGRLGFKPIDQLFRMERVKL